MKAIVCTGYGSPDVLKLEEVGKPRPKNKEVLIKVYASSVNSWDWEIVQGTPFVNRLIGLFKEKKILGADVAGRVVEVGKKVKDLKVGDEVFGDLSHCGWGGFGQYVCAKENILALKPVSIPYDEAASLPQAGVLALQGLFHKGQHIQEGQKVLINGAGGGVGTFAVQIAKSYGAQVTGVDTTGKLDMVRSIGADFCIDYTKEDFTKNGCLYDMIIDVHMCRSIFEYKRSLSANGTYVVIGGSNNRIMEAMFLGPLLSVLGRKKMGLLLHWPKKKDLDFIKELVVAGKVKPVIDRRYPLSEVSESIKYFSQGQVKGKIIITVDNEE